MDEVMIKKAMMDISVPENTGGPPAEGVEECECPDGFEGLSCESCQEGFYRNEDYDDSDSAATCEPCPCNDNEDSCELDEESQEVVCDCKTGWSGQFCDVEDYARDNSTDIDYDSDEQEYLDDYYDPESDQYSDILTPENTSQDGRTQPGIKTFTDPLHPDSQSKHNSIAQQRPQMFLNSRPRSNSETRPQPDQYPRSRGNPYARTQQESTTDPNSSSDPIEVKISGPRVQSVRPGETVQFDCSARPKIRIEVMLLILPWISVVFL